MENEENEIAKRIEPQKEEKKSKIFIVVIILIVVILGLVGYIAYDKLTQKEDNKIEEKDKTKKEEPKKEEPQKEETRELSAVEKEKFEEIIENINPYFSQYYPITNVKNIINNDELLSFALIKIGYDKQTFTGNDVDKIIKENFGNSVSVTNKDIICAIDNEPFYTYNATSNTYTKAAYNHGHGGQGFMLVKNYFESSNIKDEKAVTINAKVLYLGYVSSTWGPSYEVFKTYLDAEKRTNPVYQKNESEEPIEFNDNFYQSIKDKLPTTTYTFEKNNEGYYDLVSISIK